MFGAAAAVVAGRRHRSLALWAGIGAVIGPVALVLLQLAPLGQCPMCWAPVKGWARTCVWCGSNVSAQAAAIPGRRMVGPERDAERPVPAPTPAVTAEAPAAPAPTQSLPARSTGPAAPLQPRSTPATTPPAAPVHAVDLPPVTMLPVPEPPRALASAIFVTGSLALRAGSWYTLELDGPELVVRGPLEADPRTAVLSRPVAELDSYAFNGQLIVHGERGLVLVFMRVSGDTAEHVAEVIADAARDAGEAAS